MVGYQGHMNYMYSVTVRIRAYSKPVWERKGKWKGYQQDLNPQISECQNSAPPSELVAVQFSAC